MNGRLRLASVIVTASLVIGVAAGCATQSASKMGSGDVVADRLQPRKARPAGDHVILGVHLEPQPFRRAGKRRIVVLRLQAEPGGEDSAHGRASVREVFRS